MVPGGAKAASDRPGEICIRCNTCETRCPTGAISHNQANYVVDAERCKFCMACVFPCPTGAIDNWVIVERPYSLAEQFAWRELPIQELAEAAPPADALDEEASAILKNGTSRNARDRPPSPIGLQTEGQRLHQIEGPVDRQSDRQS